MQTRSLGWARLFDVRYDHAWTRFLTIGNDPVCGVSVQDTIGSPEWGHIYNPATEMVVGIGTHDTVEEVLSLMSAGTSLPGDPGRPARGLGGVAKAFKVHNRQVVEQLDLAARYRSKPTIVMWSSEYATRPRRLARIARQLGMVKQLREGVPVYVRHVPDAHYTDT